MKKTIVDPHSPGARGASAWLDLDNLASVEISSEDPAFPIEGALVEGSKRGWRAGAPGLQMIRLSFAEPQRVRRMCIEIDEPTTERTQELSITCASEGGSPREMVRQRWNFSPAGSTREEEHYVFDLHRVTSVELRIEPDVANAKVFASLTRLRIG